MNYGTSCGIGVAILAALAVGCGQSGDGGRGSRGQAEPATEWIYRANTQRTGCFDTPGPEEQPVWKWEYATGTRGWRLCSPVIAGQTVLIADERRLIAIEIETGATRWQFEGGGHIITDAAVVDSVVYFACDDMNVYALRLPSGEEVWRHRVEKGRHLHSSPAVADGKVFFGGHFSLHAVGAETGDHEWSYETKDEINAHPTIAGKLVLIGSNDKSLHAVDMHTGQVRWQFPAEGIIECAAAVVDTAAYFTAEDNLFAVSTETGKEIWRFTTPNRLMSTSPAVAQGRVILSRDSVFALDAATGELEWVFCGPDTLFTESFYTPSIADGVVYVGMASRKHRNDRVYALDFETGEMIWEYEDKPTSTTEIDRGVLFYYTMDGFLYALQAPPRQE